MNILRYELNWNSYNLTWVKQSIFCLLLCAYILLSGCQSVEEEMPFQPPTPSPESTKTAISPQVTRPTPIPTLTSTPKSATLTPIALLLPPTPTQPLPTPTPFLVFTGQELLIYTMIIGGRDQIYALEPGGVSQFIASGRFFANPPLSPDQTKMIIDTNYHNRSFADSLAEKVVLYDLQRHEVLPLNLMSYPTTIFWSKDGNSLVYTTSPVYTEHRLEIIANQLVLYDLASGENRVLVEAEAILFTDGGWAIDNQHIAYVAKVNGQYDLFTINSETLEIRQLSNTPEVETTILWSPTALQLMVGTTVPDERSAFAFWPWPIDVLYLVDLENNEWQYLTDRVDFSLSVSWSPDGQQIVFVDTLLCIKNLETGNESCPVPEPYRNYFVDWYTRPIWSPDMKWIAFRAKVDTCYTIYFWELETNQVISGNLECDADSHFPISPIIWSTADFSADQ